MGINILVYCDLSGHRIFATFVEVYCTSCPTTRAGEPSPRRCLSGFLSGKGCDSSVFGLAGGSWDGGMYHDFLSYFCIIKSFTLISSLDSGSGGLGEFHKPSQDRRQTFGKRFYLKSHKNYLARGLCKACQFPYQNHFLYLGKKFEKTKNDKMR